MAQNGDEVENFTQDPTDERLEETKRIVTLYFIVAAVIMGVLLFIAIRKSVKLCFFDFFYTEPEMDEKDFKPATVFTVPSVLLGLQKRYEEMNRNRSMKKKKKKKKKPISAHMARRADDRVGLTSSSESTSSCQTPESQRVFLPNSLGKQRPKLFYDGSDNPLSAALERSPSARDSVEGSGLGLIISAEEGREQNHVDQSRSQAEESPRDSYVPQPQGMVEEDETSDQHFRRHEEESDDDDEENVINVNEINQAAPGRDTSTQRQSVTSGDTTSKRESTMSSQRGSYGQAAPGRDTSTQRQSVTSGDTTSKRESTMSSQRGSYGNEMVVPVTVENGYVNEAYSEEPDRVSSVGGSVGPEVQQEENQADSHQDLLAAIREGSSGLRRVSEKSRSSRPPSRISEEELRVFIPGAVASIARQWQNRNRAEVPAPLPGMYGGDEGSVAEQDGIVASFKAEEPQHEDDDDDDDVFIPSRQSTSESSNGNKFEDSTMMDVETMDINGMAVEEGSSTIMTIAKSEDSTPAPSTLMLMSDEEKSDLFKEDPLGLALADIDDLELEEGSSHSSSGDGKSPKLGKFGQFNMDWGTSKNFPMMELSGPSRTRYKSRYKKNQNPGAQRITPHRAQRNWGKMMKDLYDVGDF